MYWQGLAARDAIASRTLAWTGEEWEGMETIWEKRRGVRSGVSWGPLGLSESALGPTDAFGGRLGGLCGTSWGDLGDLVGRLGASESWKGEKAKNSEKSEGSHRFLAFGALVACVCMLRTCSIHAVFLYAFAFVRMHVYTYA